MRVYINKIMKDMKTGKAPNPSGISAEMLKYSESWQQRASPSECKANCMMLVCEQLCYMAVKHGL